MARARRARGGGAGRVGPAALPSSQEAAFLYESIGGEYDGADRDATVRSGVPTRANVTSLEPAVPAIASVLRAVLAAFPRLSRAHFHSLAYHAVAYQASRVGGGTRSRQ